MIRRVPTLVTVSVVATVSPSRTRAGTSRANRSCRGDPATIRSTAASSTTNAAHTPRPEPSAEQHDGHGADRDRRDEPA